MALRHDTDAMRTLALAFASTGDPAHAATTTGITAGFAADRPWNFGLDIIWQGHARLARLARGRRPLRRWRQECR